MKRTMKQGIDGLMKNIFLQMMPVIVMCGLLHCLSPVIAEGSDSLTGTQEQTLKSPPPDPSGAGTPGQVVSCTVTATPRNVKPGDTIHIRVQTLPPAGTSAVFSCYPTATKFYVEGVQGIYEMNWLVPEGSIEDPSIYYNIMGDPKLPSLCNGVEIFRLPGPPEIQRYGIPMHLWLGERIALYVSVTGNRPFTYLWEIDGHRVTEGPTDDGSSTITYAFNKEGAIWVHMTVTNPNGSNETSQVVSVTKKSASMQFTEQPPYLVAPGYTIEWCIRYSRDPSGEATLISSFGDGSSEAKRINNQEGTVCIQHIYQKTGSYDVSFTIAESELHQGITVAGCPRGFEVCGKDCMPEGKGCCDPAPGFCEVKPLCCAGGCCTTSQFCHEGKVCCTIGMVGCPGQAGCCTINQNCCTGGCCDGPCCAGGCCNKGEQCCGGKCCSAGDQCCNGGTHCCPPNKVCTASGCADPQCLPAACCPERPVPCPSTCCYPGQACCGDGCMTAGRTCCGTYSCSSGQACCGSGCMDAGNDCCSDGSSCPAGSVCCGEGCCPTYAVCIGGSCCAKGYKPCGNGKCCPDGYSCCTDGGCCPGACGPTPGTCVPVQGQSTGMTQSLQQLQSEGAQRIAPSLQ